ncbi:hypothetical protein ACFWXO_44885, partial [Kitasatospora sp. NPDC059088]|uniref:hypothetical protein n=1 Tax=Kitasatospora sp. NPDC059088 TaxID=3346722 RepID=UPI0036AD209C
MASVAGYLAGRTIAPRTFVGDLLRHVAESEGRPVAPETLNEAHRLRTAALRAHDTAGYEVDRLYEELRQAEEDLHVVDARERALRKILEDMEDQEARAEQRLRELRTADGTDSSTGATGPTTEHGRTDALERELLDIRSEFEDLYAELARTRELCSAADTTCLGLEARVVVAENALKSNAPPAGLRLSGDLLDPGGTSTLLNEVGGKVGTTLDLGFTAHELCQVLVPRVA